MTSTLATAVASRVDRYPSRVGLPASMQERDDPVVYAQDYRPAPITRAQVEQYREQGFFVLENGVSEDRLGRLCDELQRLRSSPPDNDDAARVYEPGDNTLRSIFSIHTSNALFAELAADPRLVNIARFLLDDDVYIHQSRLNYKPGFRGREFFWHSDFETWHVEDGMPAMRALSMSVTLTENSPNNGPLMLIPGSHKHFVACDGSTPKNHYIQSLRKQEYGVPPDDILTRLIDEGGIAAVDARPGSIIVFDCNTMHGSNGNITPSPRSNAFFVYNAMSNQVGEPYCNRPPRPEHVCTRHSVYPLQAGGGRIMSAQHDIFNSANEPEKNQ